MFKTLKPMHGTVRLHGDQANGILQFTQTPPGADEGAARSQPGNEMGHLAVRLGEDLRSGRLVMRTPISIPTR